MNSSIVFLPSNLEYLAELINNIDFNSKIVVLDSTKCPINQITQNLIGDDRFSKIHLVSHGAAGKIFLGKHTLSIDNLERYASQIAKWRALDVFIYGCRVAAGNIGQRFLERLHHLSGSNIAASSTPTGHSNLGGNWQLETIIGKIQSQIAFKPSIKTAFKGILNADNFADATPITGTGFFFGDNFNATVEGGLDENGNPIEPSGSNWRFSDADNSVWWRWTAPTSNPYVFSVGAPFNQSQAAVYTGTSLENLTELVSIGEFSNFSIPDDFENFGDPVDTTAGTPYNIQIDIHRFQGPYSLSIAEGSNINNDNIANATPIDSVGSYWSTNVFATVETNEPSGSNWNSRLTPGLNPYEVANTIWWRWSKPATGIYSFSTENSGSTETYIAIYLDDGTEIASSDGFGVFDTISNVNLNSEND
ncbi:MAG: DUF4347 domain-containing protein, partial [Bacteroidota bacterium]